MALYRGFSSIDFKSGIISKGSFPSQSIRNIITIDGEDQYAFTVSPISKKVILEYTGNNTLVLTDIKLVERNLLNHMFTKIGSRIMMPKFGSRIPDMIFEPLTEETVNICRNEIEKIVKYDPRVSLNKLNVTPLYDLNTITISLSLNYIELNITKNMNFNIDFIA